jgi:hypothetical protein
MKTGPEKTPTTPEIIVPKMVAPTNMESSAHRKIFIFENATVIDRCQPAVSFPKSLNSNSLLQQSQAIYGKISYENAIVCYVITR